MKISKYDYITYYIEENAIKLSLDILNPSRIVESKLIGDDKWEPINQKQRLNFDEYEYRCIEFPIDLVYAVKKLREVYHIVTDVWFDTNRMRFMINFFNKESEELDITIHDDEVFYEGQSVPHEIHNSINILVDHFNFIEEIGDDFFNYKQLTGE